MMKLIYKIMLWVVLVTWLKEPVSQALGGVVVEKLKSYQVGVTKFEDFKKDSELFVVTNFSTLRERTSRPFAAKSYVTPKSSSWKIIQQGQQVDLVSGNSTKKYFFLIGEEDEPVCRLTFGPDEKLFSISFITLESVTLPADKGDDDAIDIVAAKLESTYKANDYSYVFQVMYPPILKSMGSAEEVMSAIKQMEAQAKEQKIKLISWKARKPYKYIAGYLPIYYGTVRKFAIVPYETVIKVDGKKLTQNSYVLGIKDADFLDWKFVNGDKLNQEMFKKYFPDFPKFVELPKMERLSK